MSFTSGNPVAVLIDAESVAAGDAKGAVTALSARFAPLILHAFGDFGDGKLQDWCDLLEEFEGQPLQVTPTAGHENSVHICLTMNAMELLHADSASALCIFCGNGDFSQLAVRTRKAGLPVLGFGTANSGRTMAAWFDSWQVIGIDDDGGFERPEDLWADDDELTAEDNFSDDAENHSASLDSDDIAEASAAGIDDTSGGSDCVELADVVAEQDRVTDADIEAAVQAARMRTNDDGAAGPETRADPGQHDEGAMAAVEGTSESSTRLIAEPPPLADLDHGADHVADVLSSFIDDHLNCDGYALLNDVVEAASQNGLLAQKSRKKKPYDYLKQMIAEDSRFEIRTLPMGGSEPEFVRRV